MVCKQNVVVAPLDHDGSLDEQKISQSCWSHWQLIHKPCIELHLWPKIITINPIRAVLLSKWVKFMFWGQKSFPNLGVCDVIILILWQKEELNTTGYVFTVLHYKENIWHFVVLVLQMFLYNYGTNDQTNNKKRALDKIPCAK